MEDGEQENIMEIRKQRVNDVCEKVKKISGKTIDVSGVKANNLSYCMVQKAGCTVYKRLFKYFKHPKWPSSFGKYETHFVESKLYPQFSKKDSSFVMKSLRGMTVRNPYTRLWSAYIDKFILPDFWALRGRMIIKQFRQKPSEKSLQCGHDVTFGEFVKYVISTGHNMTNVNQDRHWMPASDICDPCVFKPELINKQESFLDDLKYTLQKANLQHMMPKLIAKDPVDYEIRDEINYNFKMHYKFKNCTDKQGLAERIWTAFKLNGYIPAKEPFPETIKNDTIKAESLYEMVKSVRALWQKNKDKTRSARRLALQTAYSQIPEEDKEKLRELYKYDFELFGYCSLKFSCYT